MLVIVGVSAGVATLAFGNFARNDAATSGALLGLFAEARDRAEAGGRPTAITLLADGTVETRVREANGAWRPLTPSASLAGLVPSAQTVGGQAVPVGTPIIFSPDGLGEGFTLSVSVGGRLRLVSGDAANRLTLTGDAQ